MFELILLLIVNCLVCVGFNRACYWEFSSTGITSKMIFWWVDYYGHKFVGKWVMKPISSCLVCMASLHSYPYLYFNGLDWGYPIYILALAGLNYIVHERFIS